MNEDKKYEPLKITLKVGERINALTITDALIQYLRDERESKYFAVEGMDAAYEDARMIGEALLSVYRSYKRAEELSKELGR